MAVKKEYVRTIGRAGWGEFIQALTQATTATRVNNYGVTTITSAGSGTTVEHAFLMNAPTKGVRKAILVDPNSTRTVGVYNASTAVTYFGSTANALAFSTGAGTREVNLIGLSTSQWAVVSKSTGVTLVASTIGA